MDQLHAARRDLQTLAVAVKAQPDELRETIAILTATED